MSLSGGVDNGCGTDCARRNRGHVDLAIVFQIVIANRSGQDPRKTKRDEAAVKIERRDHFRSCGRGRVRDLLHLSARQIEHVKLDSAIARICDSASGRERDASTITAYRWLKLDVD